MARAGRDDAGGNSNPNSALQNQRAGEIGGSKPQASTTIVPTYAPPVMAPSASYTTSGTASTGPGSAISYAPVVPAPVVQKPAASAAPTAFLQVGGVDMSKVSSGRPGGGNDVVVKPGGVTTTAGGTPVANPPVQQVNNPPVQTQTQQQTGGGSTGTAPAAQLPEAMAGALKGIGSAALKSIGDYYTMVYAQLNSLIEQTGNMWELDPNTPLDPDTRMPKFIQSKGADGNPIPTSKSKLSAAEIAKLTAETAVQQSIATGKYKDPVTGQWQDLPESVLKKAQANLANYQASKTEAEKEFLKGPQTALTNAETAYKNQQTADLQQRLILDKQKALADAVADPRRSVEAAMMMQLYGNNVLQNMQGQQVPGTQGMQGQNYGAQGVPSNFVGSQDQGLNRIGRAIRPGESNQVNFMQGAPPPMPTQPGTGGQSMAPGFVGQTGLGPVTKDPGGVPAQNQMYGQSTMGQYEAYRARQGAQQPTGAQQATGGQDQMVYAGGTPNFNENTGTYTTQNLKQVPNNFVGGNMPSIDASYGAGGYSLDQINQAKQATPYAVNANLNAALQGQYVPGAGLKSGGMSQVTSIAGARPSFGSYAKINPVSLRNMNDDTRGRYESLALSNEGLDKGALARQNAMALPGTSMRY